MTADQRETLAAAMECVLPPVDGPGAAGAFALGFADWVMAQPYFAPRAAAFAGGLARLDACAVRAHGCTFAACAPEARPAVLDEFAGSTDPSDRRFMQTLVRMALSGVLCSPRYGGNRDEVGWRWVGFAPGPHVRKPDHTG